MIQLPHWLALVAGLVFAGFFVARSVLSRVRDRVNPYVIDHGKPVEGFIGVVLQAVVVVLLIYLVAVTVRPELQHALGMANVAEDPRLRWAAASLMALATLWTGWAQLAMRSSWRVGIPEGQTLPLRTDGPFRLSRNPIFLGVLVFLLGLTLWSPTVVTGAVLAAAYVAVEVQVRLEEAHLQATQGGAYAAYRGRVRRWL